MGLKKDEFLKNLAYTKILFNNIIINMGSGCRRSEYPHICQEKIFLQAHGRVFYFPVRTCCVFNLLQEHIQ